MQKKTSYDTLDFEVFGKVQGVYFRKYTQEEAKKLGLVGWVMNTESGTVVGTLQGPSDKVKTMKNWLEKVGSPKSKIEKCNFANESQVTALGFKAFDVRK